MNNVVTTLAPSFLIGSSSFLQATSKPIISWMGSKFSRIRPGTYELPALERLEKFLYSKIDNYLKSDRNNEQSGLRLFLNYRTEENSSA